MREAKRKRKNENERNHVKAASSNSLPVPYPRLPLFLWTQSRNHNQPSTFQSPSIDTIIEAIRFNVKRFDFLITFCASVMSVLYISRDL